MRERAPLLVHCGSLVLGFAFLLFENRHQWFFGDDWDFLLHKSLTHDTLSTLMEPHNEHWSTVPVVVFRVIFGLVGLDHPMAYVVPVLLAHLAVVHVLWRLLPRLGTSSWVATLLVIPVLVFGAGAENLLWAFQLGFVSSVAWGLGAGLLQEHPVLPRRTLMLSWTFSVLSLASSGVGVTMLLLAGGVAWVRRGLRGSVRATVVPGLIFLVWYHTYGHPGTTASRGGVSTSTLADGPAFVATGLQTAAGGLVEWQPAGVLVLVGVIVVLARGSRVAPEWRLAAVFAVTAALFFLITAVGRVGLGVDESKASRYTYIAGILLSPALVWALLQVGAGRDASRWVAPVATGIVVALGAGETSMMALSQQIPEQRDRLRILAGMRIVQAGEPVLNQLLEPDLDPDVRVVDVRALQGAGRLPDLAGVSQAALADERARLQLKVGGPVDHPSRSLPLVRVGPGAVLERSRAGCPAVTASTPSFVVLGPGSGASKATSTGAGPAALYLVGPGITVPGPAGTWTPGEAVELQSSLPSSVTLRADIPVGVTTFCAP